MSVTGTNINLTLRNVKGSELTYTELDNNQSSLKNGVESHSHDEFAATLGTDDNYVTDAEKVKLANLSGTNTGDQDLSGYSLTTHNHTGTYEPANSNIQSHISSTSNPHSVTAAQVGADPLGTAAGLVSTHASSSDHDGRYYTETETNSLLSNKQNTSEKGQALGYCPLDGSIKIAEAYLPDSVLGQVEYQGTWNATTNTPAIPAASSTNKGWYYIVAVSGTTTVDAISEWTIGDWIISNGATWNKVDNTDSVSSVFGRAGTIVANSGDYTASQVTNVPQGNIAAITVQAAINELDSEKAATTDSRFVTNGNSHDHVGGDGAAISLTAAVSGILPVANGGTGSSTQNFVDLTTDQTIAGTKTFSSTVVLPAGTAALPSLTTTGDINTGICFPAADTVAITGGGVERARITSNGNVTIGSTVDAGTRLYVSGLVASSYSATSLNEDQASITIGNPQTTVADAAAHLNLIVTGNPGSSGAAALSCVRTGDGSAAMTFRTKAAGMMGERARITSSGYLLVNNTASAGAYPLQVTGASYFNGNIHTTGGLVWAFGTGSWQFRNSSKSTILEAIANDGTGLLYLRSGSSAASGSHVVIADVYSGNVLIGSNIEHPNPAKTQITSPTLGLSVKADSADTARFWRPVNSVSAAAGRILFGGYVDTSTYGDYASIGAIIENSALATKAGAIEFKTANAGTLTERMRITSTGALLIGTSTDPGYGAKIHSTAGISLGNAAVANGNVLDWYEEGTFTATATGMTTSPTGTVKYTRNGNIVVLDLPAITGTSNATTFTLTGMPSQLRPAAVKAVITRCQDNGVMGVCVSVIGTDGVITCYKDVVAGAFTASGTKSIYTLSVNYTLQ